LFDPADLEIHEHLQAQGRPSVRQLERLEAALTAWTDEERAPTAETLAYSASVPARICEVLLSGLEEGGRRRTGQGRQRRNRPLSVTAEVVVFFVAGPWLLRCLKPPAAIALAALAGAFRWLVAAFTADVAALAFIQPLHGITFALLHLSCMRLLAQSVPDRLAATAQAIYGTVGVGAATALFTVLSGLLYARMGAWAFGVMSMLCLAALPITRLLSTAGNSGSVRP
jgi:hypothetical protein